MFKWLEQEIAMVKMPKFHLVDGPANARFLKTVEKSPLEVPPSYRKFVVRFGNAYLYRCSRHHAFYVGVYASPRQAFLDDGTCLFHLGYHGGASVYTKSSDNSIHGPIYEWEAGFEDKVADRFEEWLRSSCASARKMFSAKEWRDILHGPRPFTPKEREIIKARRAIRWRVVGIDAQGRHLIEIVNEGKSSLPAFTLGMRSKDRRLHGAAWVYIGHIGPGQKDVMPADCYKDRIPPRQAEVFSLPDPQPEDRGFYWEFVGTT